MRASKRALVILLLVSSHGIAQPPRFQRKVGQVRSVELTEEAGVPSKPASPDYSVLDAFRNPGGSRPPEGPARSRMIFQAWSESASAEAARELSAGLSEIEREPNRTVIHRFISNPNRHRFLSYTITVVRLPEPGERYLISFGDTNPTVLKQTLQGVGIEISSPVTYPVPQYMQDGETLPITLSSNQVEWPDLVDKLYVGSHFVVRSEGARDMFAQDGIFLVSKARAKLNGLPVEVAAGTETVSGSGLWLYVPRLGRCSLSFRNQPELGFFKAGEVAGSSLTFAVAGNVVHLDSSTRIADAGSGIFKLYVRVDSAWRPADRRDQDRVLIGLGE